MNAATSTVVRAVATIFVAWLCLSAEAGAQIHTTHDHVPDFCAGATITSVGSGAWSNPATWSPARVPGAGDVVRVAAGRVVTLDTQMASAAACVGIDGTLTVSRATTTRLWAGTVMVYAAGTLEAGTAAAPMPAGVTAEIVIANQALNPASDPDQYGTGLLVFGTIRLHGSVRTPTWTRLAAEPRAGQTTLTLAQGAGGWDVGDRVVVPDTRHMKWNDVASWRPVAPQWEERTVASVSGTTVTLTSPLSHDHLGARNGDGGLDFLPHVGNLTRNVVVRSEVAIGASGTRGHTLYTARATVDIRYTRFTDLGRTTIDALDPTANHIGRYAIHAHHLMGPVATPANGYQFTFIGNAVDGGSTAHRLKWGMAVHNSHYGLIQGNVLYNWAGSAVMFEDGSESFNVVDGNLAVRSVGEGDRMALGTEGGGFWFKGPNNYVRNNVAANLWANQPEGAYGFKFFLHYLGKIRVPNFKGADTSVAGQFTERDGNALPILEFTNNEVYGAAQGLTYWWVNAFGNPGSNPAPAETVFRDTKLWHVYNVGVYHYPSDRITFDGLTIRGGQPPGVTACCSVGHYGGDYGMKDLVIRRADIQGMGRGIDVSMHAMGPMRIEDSLFRNDRDIIATAMYNVGGGGNVRPRLVIARNTRHVAWPGRPHVPFTRNWDLTARDISAFNLPVSDELKVYAYQGNPALNFQAYYAVQATQSVAGGLAPCATRRPEVDGLACPITYVAQASAVPGAPAGFAAEVLGTLVRFTWSPPSSTVQSYRFEAGHAPGGAEIATTLDGALRQFDVPNVPAGQYYVRIRALNALGYGPVSNEVVVTVGGLAQAPTNLRTAVSGDVVGLTWDYPASGVEFLLDVGTSAGVANILSAVPVGAGRSQAFHGVPAGNYVVWLRARSGSAVSAPSAATAFSVGVPAPLPGRPSGLTAATGPGGAVSLKWSSGGGGGVTTYVLETGTAPGLSNAGVFAVGAAPGAAASGVPAGTYYARVRGRNAAGDGPASAEIKIVVP